MEYKCIFIVIILVYLPVIITGQYTLRGVPESYAVLGENYRLQCDVTDSTSLVFFSRNNIDVCSIISHDCGSATSEKRYKCGCINNNNKQLYLIISNINIQDDTTWSCIRRSGGGQGSTTIPVYYGPLSTRFNPTSDNIDVIEGKSQSINCLADCKPDCNITWSKDGYSATLSNPLSLSTRGQIGTYTCTVKHTVLNKQLTKQLKVQTYYSPDELTFSPDVTSINIIEGRDQTITCLTDCYDCNYKWTGPVSSSTKDLVLTQIKRNQEGNYTCEATNIKDTNPKTRSKSIQVNVHYPPNITSITSDTENNETDEDSDVIFNCNVDSKPVSTITWSSSTNTDTNTGQQWTLTQAECQDTGIYTCTANNGIGQSTPKSLPLNIRCSPRINGDLKDEVKNRLGEEVTLLIDVIAYPKPSFKWIQESTGDELTPDHPPQQVSVYNYISSLTLIIQQASFGNYIVTVSNDKGDTNYTIKIIDGDPPKLSEPPSPLNIPAVVGGVVVAVVVVVTIVIVAVIVIKRTKKKLPDESYATFSNRNPEDRTYEDLKTRPGVYENSPQNDREYENIPRN